MMYPDTGWNIGKIIASEAIRRCDGDLADARQVLHAALTALHFTENRARSEARTQERRAVPGRPR